MSFTEEQLKELAQQLSKPNGDDGISIANMMHDSNIGMTQKTIAALNIANGDLILELGHGNCKHLPEILNKAENTSYYGLEISELMQKQAAENNSAATQGNKASFHLYDGNKIPFSDNTFNNILTVNTIYFWEDAEAFIQEIYRVLFVKNNNVTKALDIIEAEFQPTEIRDEIVDFIRNSNRGVMRGFGTGS